MSNANSIFDQYQNNRILNTTITLHNLNHLEQLWCQYHNQLKLTSRTTLADLKFNIEAYANTIYLAIGGRTNVSINLDKGKNLDEADCHIMVGLNNYYPSFNPYMRAKSFDAAFNFQSLSGRKAFTKSTFFLKTNSFNSSLKYGHEANLYASGSQNVLFTICSGKKIIDNGVTQLQKKIQLMYKHSLTPRSLFLENVQDIDEDTFLHLTLSHYRRNNKSCGEICSQLRELLLHPDYLNAIKFGLQYNHSFFFNKVDENIYMPPTLRIFANPHIVLASNNLDSKYVKFATTIKCLKDFKYASLHNIFKATVLHPFTQTLRPNDAAYLNELKGVKFPGAKFGNDNQHRIPPLASMMLKTKVYHNGISLQEIMDPSCSLKPYAYNEISVAQNDKSPRTTFGVGATLIGSMLKCDLFYNLFSILPAGEAEHEWGFRFTIE